MFELVLVANRGEIAVRVMRTLRRMGIASAAVYTDVDRAAPHVGLADVAIALGPADAYLDIDRVVDAAVRSGAAAVHPGYGFLSENAAFARACAAAGVAFIGPPAEAIELMGDKINAKRAVAAHGVPVVPGRDEAGLDDAQLAAAALEVGLPVLLKPSAGGGGKGMRLVAEAGALADEIAAARREAAAAFGDSTLLVERFVPRPRHVEAQVFADFHGGVVALGERECSLQRRHQKIVEEAPSPLIGDETRRAMFAAAVEAARACGYVGAGTVEFILSADRPGEFFFMEMNTRLQVEHPVTEAVLGVDLVELQVRVAAGERLPWAGPDDVPAPRGHAVEARVYAEDPARGFLPSSGRVLALHEPSGVGSVRVDSGIRAGSEVATTYDPMLSKVIAWGEDRPAALGRLRAALSSTTVLGLTTNVGFLGRLLELPEVVAGDLDTGLVDRRVADLTAGEAPVDVVAAAALLEIAAARDLGPWGTPDGWRVGGPALIRSRWTVGSQSLTAAVQVVTFDASGVEADVAVEAEVCVGDHGPVAARARVHRPDLLEVELDGRLGRYIWARDGAVLWLGRGADAWRLTPHRPAVAPAGSGTTPGSRVTSPMPGKVVAVYVEAGEEVAPGQKLVAVEAMKMEHVVTAAAPGIVVQLLVRAGDSVRLDQPLIVVDLPGASERGDKL